MKARRILASVVVGACVVGGTLGMAQHQSSDVHAVGIGTAATAQRGCSTDCGKADEPATVDGSTLVIGCDWSNDEMSDQWLSDELVRRCDYRLTGEACEEDELCALQQIRETEAFSR